MKKIILISLLLLSCQGKVADSEHIEQPCCAELLDLGPQTAGKDSIIDQQAKDILILKHVGDSLRIENGIANGRLVRINEYVRICNKNASQKTFFFGWVSRALKE